jgi:hypothetical protein
MGEFKFKVARSRWELWHGIIQKAEADRAYEKLEQELEPRPPSPDQGAAATTAPREEAEMAIGSDQVSVELDKVVCGGLGEGEEVDIPRLMAS